MMSRLLPQALFLAVSFSGLVLCPHSKVEESFSLQATHDLYYYGIPTELLSSFLGWNDQDDLYLPPYDHLQFPGVVPRSFAGPLVISKICQLASWIVSPIYKLMPLQVQFLARFVLLVLVWHGWFRLSHALISSGRELVARYLWLVSTCQFHMPYYASRMLPNSFALVLVLHCYAYWFEDSIQSAAACLVLATVVFRCDTILLLLTVGLTWLVRGDLSLWKALKVGVLTGLSSLVCTIPLDSLLWQRWVWPEGQVFYYNTILGKSSDWGTSSWHWYVTNALPRATLLTMLMLPLSVLRVPRVWSVDTTWMPYLIPGVGFLVLYSCLGHKEMRFLFPVMPLVNLAAAAGISKVHQWAFPAKGKSSTLLSRIAYLGCLGCLLGTLLGSLFFLDISRHNYPGGEALEKLAKYLQESQESKDATVWVDVASGTCSREIRILLWILVC
jgi:alpha-1,6-mannosyltransferase